MEKVFIFIFIISYSFYEIQSVNVVRPRGIAFERASLYIPDKDFACLDGSFVIPFSFVNDDYCDCPDASDEPGTSACPNGTFHCTNAGHRSLTIPSSRVNDGICDCCDGSDEWGTTKNISPCINTCEELGRAAREEAERVQQMIVAGNEIREQFILKAKEQKTEKQKRISELMNQKIEAESIKNETMVVKEKAEELEKSVLEKYRIIADEKRKQQEELQKVKDQNEAYEAFHDIDTNKNNIIEENEIEGYSTFDQNKDGMVSEDEKDYFMETKKEMNLDEFMLNGWSRLKQLLLTENVETETTEDTIEKDGDGQFEEIEQSDDHPDDDIEHLDSADAVDESQYDEETQLIVEEAKRARESFEEADRKFRDIERKISHLHDSLSKDYGIDDEYATLDGECYELSDHEYVYKLCLFDQITQRSKNGGSEIRLGTWNSWIGEPKYRTMLYDRGQSCWNGPPRSTHVRLSCGLEAALISASEPNRCEYVMDFIVPAACVQFNEKTSTSERGHDEL
ncbi:glucosidase 2 subunit beta [Daktulosphaira vitifoliae]|uniref:glucosidase 2 subunit beta n=1 Tax=Daktulosphaira vitifoliae TaxID=58002 RepID=UPI0021A97F83|nr:glucosidase 2 subunit beta [Daktulosphaira vitifoliae]